MVNTRAIFVSIVGKPNVGKSSLLNEFMGEKIAIVTKKPQTTRTKITGILTEEEIQIVFFDTPGIHKPKSKLSNHMVNKIKESVLDVDLNLFVVEFGSNISEAEINLIDSFKKNKNNVILVVNKIDMSKNNVEVSEFTDKYKKLLDFADVISISVKNKDGLTDLLNLIKRKSIESPHFFPSDELTDQPEKVIVAELIREKLLINMFDEIPHGIAIEVEKMRKRENSDIMDIDCIIYCDKKSHKGMVIGKNGLMLKKIATQSRIDAENFLNSKINLKCWVKVKEDWRNKESFIKNFGLNS
ncbi:MAG: GTPase Era [Oscillospiraceae bacterium]